METQKPKTETEEAPKRKRGRPRKTEVTGSVVTKESGSSEQVPSEPKTTSRSRAARAKAAVTESEVGEVSTPTRVKTRRTKLAAENVEPEKAAEVEAALPEEKRKYRKRTTYVNTMTGMVKMDAGIALDLEAQQKSREDMELDRLRAQHPEYFQEESAAVEEFTPIPEHSDEAILPSEPSIPAPLMPEPEENGTEKEHTGLPVQGILEFSDQVPPYGFLRQEGVSSENDIYVSPIFIRKFNLKPGELIKGFSKRESGGERYKALVYVSEVNGVPPFVHRSKMKFDEMTPLFPRERFRLEGDSNDKAMRILDLIAPIGKGQRGLIVAPPKSGKTILLQKIARAIRENYPEVELMILLIDERPEEVTDMKEYVDAPVFYSTFDELPTNHIRIAELVLNRARGLVELGKDVVILLDSITRLARAYNIALPSSGRTLSGGLDTSALHRPKRFLGSARNTKEGGSLTILATALIETGSRMDDVIFEEFKGTGNMELILDRKLSERRIFPSIDIKRSGTRREELLLSDEEYEAILKVRRVLDKYPGNEPAEKLINDIVATRNNAELISLINKKL